MSRATVAWLVLPVGATATAATAMVIAAAATPRLMVAVVLAHAAFVALHAWVGRPLHAAGEAAALPAPAPPRMPVIAAEWGAIAVVVAAFVALNVPALTRGLEYDELVTAHHFVVHRSLWTTVSSQLAFNNHPAYSLAASLTTRALGTGEWVLRLPALVFGAATVIAVWWVARRTCERGVAVLAAALLAVSPFFAAWSRTARGYTGLALTSLLAGDACLILMRRRSPRVAVAHAVVGALAVYVHLYGAVVLAVQYLFLVWGSRARPDRGGLRLLWRSFAAIAGITIMLYVPLVARLVRGSVMRGRTAIVPGFLADTLRDLCGTDAAVVVAGLVALAVAGVVLSGGPAGVYHASVFVLPLAVMWLVVRPFDLYPRFFTYWIPTLMSLVAGGAAGLTARGRARLPRRAASAVTAGVAVFLATVAVGWTRQDLRAPIPAGYREALPHAASGAMVFAAGADSAMFAYYVGAPMAALESLAMLEARLRDATPFRVAYHHLAWNSDEDRLIHARLAQRCRRNGDGVLQVYECPAAPGGPSPP